MTDERWPYGTILRRRRVNDRVRVMVICRANKGTMITTITDPDHNLVPRDYYELAETWLWLDIYKDHWVRAEDA